MLEDRLSDNNSKSGDIASEPKSCSCGRKIVRNNVGLQRDQKRLEIHPYAKPSDGLNRAKFEYGQLIVEKNEPTEP